MTSRFSWWWLHVLFLVILQHTWVSSEDLSPTNETYWGNITSGSDLVYITNEETSRTHNSTLETYKGDITTGLDLAYTKDEMSETPNITPERHRGNVTTGPDLDYITNEETSRTPSTIIETFPSNITAKPDLVYTTNKEISGNANITLAMYKGNVTMEPDPVYITKEETSVTPNTTLERYWSNLTTSPALVYTTTVETPSTTLEIYTNNVFTKLDFPNILEDTSRTPNSTVETYANNATTGPEHSYDSDKISETPNITVKPYLNNVTNTIDLIYPSEETSKAPNSTIETYPSNVTTDAHLTYINEGTSRTPNTTLEIERTSYHGTAGVRHLVISNAIPRDGQVTISQIMCGPLLCTPEDLTTPPDLIYTVTEQPTTGTPNMILQTGAVFCLQDADCPPFSVCTDQEGLHKCQCHLGFYFHHELGCVTARTFPARIPISILSWDERSVNTIEHDNNEDEIRHTEGAQYRHDVHRVGVLFQNVLGHIPGYLSTSVIDIQLNLGHLTIVHSFSTLYPVTKEDVWRALTVSPLLCSAPHPSCISLLTIDDYQGLSLCDFDICDFSSSSCHSYGGLVTCECCRGYYKFSPTDRSCRVCGSGFQWTENGCERCPIGFGGFNCEESYLLVVIVESCVGCVLLSSLITLLVFYFRRKEPKKPTFKDSIVLGVPINQPSIRLPRAQFSWRREWEWYEPTGKVLTEVHREAESPDEPVIHMKTFGDPAKFSTPNPNHGHHNLSFISD